MVAIPRQRRLARRAQDHKAIDSQTSCNRVVACGRYIGARIIGAAAGHIDSSAACLKRRVLELGHREINTAADRSAVGEGARCLLELTGKILGGLGAVDHCPVNHHALGGGPRPFDKADCNAPMRPRPDRFDHARAAEGGHISVALELEFCGINAARNIRCQHQQKIDLFGRERRTGKHGGDKDRQKKTHSPHGHCPHCTVCGRGDFIELTPWSSYHQPLQFLALAHSP